MARKSKDKQQSVLFPSQLLYQAHSATSKAAAMKAQPGAGTKRAAVLECLQNAPAGLTDEQIQAALWMNPNTQRPRRVELLRAGLIVDSGERRKTESGCMGVVWKAA